MPLHPNHQKYLELKAKLNAGILIGKEDFCWMKIYGRAARNSRRRHRFSKYGDHARAAGHYNP